MNILLVSTLKRRVGKDVFASRSRIIYQLAEGLIGRGHSVSVLGTEDSIIDGVTTIPVTKKGWIDLPPVENPFVRDIGTLLLQARKVIAIQDSFDVIHNHCFPDFFLSLVENELKVPLITTLHVVAEDFLDRIISECKKTYFVSLSKAYAQKLKKGIIYKTIYNGVDTSFYSFSQEKREFLLWIGRLNGSRYKNGSYMDPKGVSWAIKLAQSTGEKLCLAGVVEDKTAFKKLVKPYLNKKIRWIGETASEQTLSGGKIVKLLQKAKAFLMTVNQEEPFGLVMAEAMSCGTPVIAFDRGSVKEVVKDGVTGFIVHPQKGVKGLSDSLSRIRSIDAFACRKWVEKQFTIKRMVDEYEALYKELSKLKR